MDQEPLDRLLAREEEIEEEIRHRYIPSKEKVHELNRALKIAQRLQREREEEGIEINPPDYPEQEIARLTHLYRYGGS